MGERLLNKTFLFTLVILVPIFDSLTGLLVRGDTLSTGGLGTPSQVIRFFLIFLSLIIIQSRRRYLPLLLASLYLITIEIIAFIAHQSIQGLMIGFVFSYKFIYTAFIFFTLDKIFIKENYSEKDVLNLVFKFTGVLCIVFLIGNILAIKTGIAASFLRSQGLFSSGNGLGLLMGALTLLMLYGFKQKYLSGTTVKIIYALSLLCLVLIATKATIVFLLLNILFLIGRLPSLYRFFIVLTLILIITFYWTQIMNVLNVAFEIIIFRFENKVSWMGFLLSGRQDYLDTAFSAFEKSDLIVLRTIFGAGSFLSYELPNNFSLNYKMLEMDVFDTFFIYGLVGIFLYFYSIIYCTVKAFRKSRIIGWCSLTLFLHSIFAGHTMFNGLSATGIVFILLLIRHSSPKYQKQAVQQSYTS